jgi:exodeoxyribonuclease VII large subunit
MIGRTMPEIAATHNILEYSVSEVSQAIRQTVEQRFEFVRVRGEITGFKQQQPSGHVYFSLKDENAVLNGVMWKGSFGRLNFKPENGMEVICTGKITTYAGRSYYQIIVERMEIAGMGALMALLEKRRQQLAAEGLFAAERKRPLPFLPTTIGVVTSPTGAVIRDILHRIRERFPVRVLVWPVLVQGDGAAEQVAAAIHGFNALPEGGDIPRPDVLIVARGGGSLEDLWAFNEEMVVRAAAASQIPLISAVGHETDTTLIDYASDRRAPTPTAAAEMAVPVREEWLFSLKETERRMDAATLRGFSDRQQQVEGLARGLPRPEQLLLHAEQRLDDRSERLQQSLLAGLKQREQQLLTCHHRLQPPHFLLSRAGEMLHGWQERMQSALPAFVKTLEQRLAALLPRLTASPILRQCEQEARQLATLGERINLAHLRLIERQETRLQALTSLLESLNYQRVLERGFALVRRIEGGVVTAASQVTEGERLAIQWQDGERIVTVGEGDNRQIAASASPKPAAKAKATAGGTQKQGSLF